MPDTIERAKELQAEIVEMRRHLHAIPEISFEERLTSKFVADRLEQLGYRVRRNVGKTGVVADKGAGVTIAIRAEMDGLPLSELNRVEYASTHKGISHACGHDVSMACVLGAAKLLAAVPPKGCVRIIMQPAAEEACDEKGKTGTARMIDEGAIDDVSAIIALHVDSTMPVGTVAVIADPLTAAPNEFSICIESPDAQKFDALLAAVKVVQSLTSSDVVVTSFQSASSESDSPPASAHVQGVLRNFSKDMRKSQTEELHRICAFINAQGGSYKIEFAHGSAHPPRHQEVVEAMHQAATALIGAEKVKLVSRKTWTEDFSGFTKHLPGSLLLLGGGIAYDRRTHHSSTFDVDESSFYVGSAILAETVEKLVMVFA